MYSRLLFALVALLPLLVACSDVSRPVSLDLVGSSRFTSGNRTAAAGDTLTARIYAVGNDGQAITRVEVKVSYEPEARPITYPVPATSFDPKNVSNDLLRTYLDSNLSTRPRREFVYQPTLGVRTTSGTERWEFIATDAAGNSASRAFRITVRKTDSLAVVHSYTLSLLAPTGSDSVRNSARRYLALLPGLVFPDYSVRHHPDNQELIDLLFQPSTQALITPRHAGSAATNWTNKRATTLHKTSLLSSDFTSATTPALLQQAYDNNSASFTVPTSTGALVADQVVAFKTADDKYGLLQVAEIRATPYPALKINVRIQK